MRRFVIFVSLLMAFTAGYGEDLQHLFQQAAAYYKANNFESAAKTYEKILQEGYESASLYFNLGNAYYKKKDITSAIWYYEKARKLAPGDDDINFNLKLANTKIVDKIESVPELFFYRWWKNIRDEYSPDGWAKICLVLTMLFFIFTALYLLLKKIIVRKISFWVAFMVLLLAGLSFTFAHQSWKIRNNQKEAVIFNPAVNIKSSPDDNSVDIFVLHEGTKVTVTDNLGEWYRIMVANGSVGWVKADAMKII
jgi:tetratricopeptide (TPR) repeat protein